VANDLAQRLDPGCDLDLRVGAIPAKRTNRLGYGLIWSLDGLIDEYTAPCAAIVEGKQTTLPALSGRIEFEAGGVAYEAFLTAGSIDALAALVGSRVSNLAFRTIRYPGHLDYMQFLLDDLGLRARRDLLATLLRNGLPAAEPDAVVIHVRASGTRDGRASEELFSCRIEPQTSAGEHGALSLASAAHACALIERLRAGALAGNELRCAALASHEAVIETRHFGKLQVRTSSIARSPAN
jgi:saccharopine dehydrogenase-like NADP-dependent oxidoreductase